LSQNTYIIVGEHWDYRDVDDAASISSSETTESSESFPEENYPLASDLPKAVLEVFTKVILYTNKQKYILY